MDDVMGPDMRERQGHAANSGVTSQPRELFFDSQLCARQSPDRDQCFSHDNLLLSSIHLRHTTIMTTPETGGQLPSNGTKTPPRSHFRMFPQLEMSNRKLMPRDRARHFATREPFRQTHTGSVNSDRSIVYARVRRRTPECSCRLQNIWQTFACRRQCHGDLPCADWKCRRWRLVGSIAWIWRQGI